MKFASIGASAMLAAALIGGASLFGAGTARAATIVQTFPGFEYDTSGYPESFGQFPGEDFIGVRGVNEQPFNPALGALESVTVDASVTAYFENNLETGAPQSYIVEYALFTGSNADPIPSLYLSPVFVGTSGELIQYSFDQTFTLPYEMDEFIGWGAETGLLVAAVTTQPTPYGIENTFSQETITYTYAPVPEPATWAMMLLGFFGLGALLRRRAVAAALAN